MRIESTRGNARGSGYDRAANDWYQETAACVDAFLEVEKFDGSIYDPACGGGNIPERCIAQDYDAYGSDIVDRGYGSADCDFLITSTVHDNILTNPPFNLAQRFVEHALTLTTGKVAIVQRLAFLEGKARSKFFAETPLARVWVHSSRQSMPPGGSGQEAKGGSVAYAWFVWDHNHTGSPKLGWLP